MGDFFVFVGLVVVVGYCFVVEVVLVGFEIWVVD